MATALPGGAMDWHWGLLALRRLAERMFTYVINDVRRSIRAMVKVPCANCGEVSKVQPGSAEAKVCPNCNQPLPLIPTKRNDGGVSPGLFIAAAGGAAIGARVGGPWGMVIGGILGGLLAHESSNDKSEDDKPKDDAQ